MFGMGVTELALIGGILFGGIALALVIVVAVFFATRTRPPK